MLGSLFRTSRITTSSTFIAQRSIHRSFLRSTPLAVARLERQKPSRGIEVLEYEFFDKELKNNIDEYVKSEGKVDPKIPDTGKKKINNERGIWNDH